MTKFNFSQEEQRTAIADGKRHVHGDSASGNLRQKTEPQSISGERELKRLLCDQKEAVEKGLISTMAVGNDDLALVMRAMTSGSGTVIPPNYSITLTMEQLNFLVNSMVEAALARTREQAPPPKDGVDGISPVVMQPLQPHGNMEYNVRKRRRSSLDAGVEENESSQHGQEVGSEEQRDHLKRLTEEMRQLRRAVERAKNKTDMRKGSPFSEEMLADKAPSYLEPLKFEYDGTTDPYDHLYRFENIADTLYRY